MSELGPLALHGLSSCGGETSLFPQSAGSGARASGVGAHRLTRPTERGILLDQGLKPAPGILSHQLPQGSLMDTDRANIKQNLTGTPSHWSRLTCCSSLQRPKTHVSKPLCLASQAAHQHAVSTATEHLQVRPMPHHDHSAWTEEGSFKISPVVFKI